MAAWETPIPLTMSTATASDRVESLVREHGRLVFKIAYAALRNREDAEDVAQEVFVKVVRAAGDLERVADPQAWVARIAWRSATDHQRARRSRPATAPLETGLEPPALAPGAERAAAALQMQGLVNELMDTLPAELRQVLLLTAVEELSSRQVAAVVGASDAAVRNRLMRARQLLKEKLNAVMEGRRAR